MLVSLKIKQIASAGAKPLLAASLSTENCRHCGKSDCGTMLLDKATLTKTSVLVSPKQTYHCIKARGQGNGTKLYARFHAILGAIAFEKQLPARHYARIDLSISDSSGFFQKLGYQLSQNSPESIIAEKTIKPPQTKPQLTKDEEKIKQWLLDKI